VNSNTFMFSIARIRSADNAGSSWGPPATRRAIIPGYHGPVQRFTADGKFLYEFAPSGFRGWVHFHSMTTGREGNTCLAARHQDGRNAIVKYDRRGGYVTAWAAAKRAGVCRRGGQGDPRSAGVRARVSFKNSGAVPRTAPVRSGVRSRG